MKAHVLNRKFLFLLTFALLSSRCGKEQTAFNTTGGLARTSGHSAADETQGSETPPPEGSTGDSDFAPPTVVATGSAAIPTPMPTVTVPASLGPCAQNSNKLDINIAKKSILFYAPADGNGGSPYYLGVKQGLENAGYKVTRVNEIEKAIINMDACKLWASFKQIWMWVPCKDGAENSGVNITRSMSDKSVEALEAYYKNGGGLVVFTDYHYNNSGGIHCSLQDWGTGANNTGLSKDISSISKILGVKFSGVPKNNSRPELAPFSQSNIHCSPEYSYLCQIHATGDHPLVPIIGKMRNIWYTRVMVDTNMSGKFTYLDSDWETAAVIERKTAEFNSMALVMTGPYGYEFGINITSTSPIPAPTPTLTPIPPPISAPNIFPTPLTPAPNIFPTPLTPSPTTPPNIYGLPTGVSDKEFIGIADYFENNLRITGISPKPEANLIDAKDLLTNTMAYQGINFLFQKPKINRKEMIKSLKEQLKGKNPLEVGFSLRELIAQKEADTDSAYAYLEHQRFPVRMSAAMALSTLLKDPIHLDRALSFLENPNLSEKKLVGITRALMIIREKKSIPLLAKQLERKLAPDTRAELEVALDVLKKEVSANPVSNPVSE